jgi:ribulose-5-phosphate 4-epimerase/fuculose-1-phosphate aldolase
LRTPNDVLILCKHGLPTMGETAANGFELMFVLERACRIDPSYKH